MHTHTRTHPGKHSVKGKRGRKSGQRERLSQSARRKFFIMCGKELAPAKKKNCQLDTGGVLFLKGI